MLCDRNRWRCFEMLLTGVCDVVLKCYVTGVFGVVLKCYVTGVFGVV